MLFKQLFAALALVLSVAFVQAQTTVPNGGFENWQNVGSSTEEPTNWNSNKTGGGLASFGPQTCSRATSPHGGTYCVKMETKSYFGTAVNGNCTTGKLQAPSTNPSDGYIETVTSDANFNTAFTGRPDSLVGWFKYTPSGGDQGKVQVNLHVGAGQQPEGSTSGNVVARATYFTGNTTYGSWTRFSVPFEYVAGTAGQRTPEYFLCAMTSSASQTGGVQGSILYIDDLEVIYNPTISTGAVTGPFYTSYLSTASVSVPFTATGTYTASNVFTAQLSDANGSFASPVDIGTLSSTTSGTINATIPFATASGTGYRIRVVSSTPGITGTDNGTDIVINFVTTNIGPNGLQSLEAGEDGAAMSITESAGAISREWLYATATSGPHAPFTPAETGMTYTPNFPSADVYYIKALTTYPGGVEVPSNELIVNVYDNSVSPSGSQSLLVGSNGNQLTVTESNTATSREWKFATTSGGPYSSFAPSETGTTYTPNFAAAGTYYVVCQSIISGVTVTSNEVVVSVNSVTITTGTIATTTFEFSPTAPNATVSVPYTVSSPFITGNIFTAQLSDASGSFSNPTNIGSLTTMTSSTINATIPANTPAGTGYRIRVVGNNPSVLGSDNGVDLTVDQFSNSIAPVTAQNIALNTAGAPVTVTASQTATHEWLYAANTGGPYTSFSTPETGTTYTPLFDIPGTYYVVAASVNQYNDIAWSSEMVVNVANGTTITTSTVSGSPFYVSPKSNVMVTVNWTSDAVFGLVNTFTVQMSDAQGDFSNPTSLGSIIGSSMTTMDVEIPSTTPAGTGYRLRVVSDSPAIIGDDNGTDLEVVPFEMTVTGTADQTLYPDSVGAPISVTSTHPNATQEWFQTGIQGGTGAPFTPAETGSSISPSYPTVGTRYINVQVYSQWGDTLTSNQSKVEVIFRPVGIDEADFEKIDAYWSMNDLIVDLGSIDLDAPVVHLFDLTGREVLIADLKNGKNRIATSLNTGIYIMQLTDGADTFNRKLYKH